MEYIVHHRFKGVAACGQEMTLPYGTRLQTIGDFIATDSGQAVCFTTSEIAHKYFARNDDGHGLERGALTYAIAYGPCRKTSADGHVYRFSPEEIEMLETRYAHWLRPDASTILFNQAFFDAAVPELRLVASLLKIKA